MNKLLRLAYKSATVLLLLYVVVAGLLLPMPQMGPQMGQTSRNLFFHLPQWFAMYALMLVSLGWSVQVLRRPTLRADIHAQQAATVGGVFGVMGLITGILWSRVTWGEAIAADRLSAWWIWDPKQTGALVALMMYAAYFLLRGAVADPERRMRLAAAYNVFAGLALVPLTYLLPRLLGGLHPGSEGSNLVFSSADLAPRFRLVLYPAFMGFILLGLWIFEIRVRLAQLQSGHATPPAPLPTATVTISTNR